MQKRNQLILLLISVSLTAVFFFTKSPDLVKVLELKRDEIRDSEITFYPIKREMGERVEKVRSICKNIKWEPPSPSIIASNIILDKKHKISWCPVYKAASSMWMKNFALLGGVLNEISMKLVQENLIQMSSVVRQIFRSKSGPKPTIREIIATRKFLIVRHPFERLLSAYRDKLERLEGREYYYFRFGRHIVNRFRANRTENLAPSFSEFLQFLVTEKYFDEHWVPYFESCQPCFIDYDYIMKFENLREEQTFFIKESGLLDEVNLIGEFENPHDATTSAVVEKYFGNVDKALLKEVYELYENDFLLFSYDPSKFYSMAK